MSKVSEEVAEKDVQRWLDTKKFSEEKRTNMEASIKEMIGYVKEGNLVISDEGKITQKLNFEIGEEEKVYELEYQNRISVDDIHKRMTGSQVKAGDVDGRIRVYVAALTRKPYALIGKLDSTDWSVASTIASFFF
jgi:hypothetical protein